MRIANMFRICKKIQMLLQNRAKLHFIYNVSKPAKFMGSNQFQNCNFNYDNNL